MVNQIFPIDADNDRGKSLSILETKYNYEITKLLKTEITKVYFL